jgi:multiple sugar transport system permease protein/sn-glycerol 3-phosphate transport system permease protein
VSRAIDRPGARRVSRTWLREWGMFLALVAPNLLLLAAFTYWPLVYNGYLSLTEWDMISPEKSFVGLENYRELAREPRFWRIFLNTFYFVLGSVGITMAVALGAAILLNQKLRGRGLARAVVFTPTVLTGSAIAIVWIYLFDPNYGLFRVFLNGVGLASPKWLTDLFWAMPALLIVYVWKNFGYAVVVYLAGLQGIPRELYEAAIVDGASPWDRFRHVTWPGLGPITFFLLVTSILSSFQAFDIVAVMTKGGPVDATNTLIFHLYEEGFIAFHAGRAAAIGVVLFVLMLLVTIVQLRGVERKVHYA